MVIDTSAILAILQNEPERRSFNEAIEAAADRLISAASLLEVSIVIEARYGSAAQRDLELFLAAANIETIPFDLHQAQLALTGFQRFGKGRHPAGLNMGDCYAYALAQATGSPLLFKGNDFPLTDIEPVTISS